MPLIILKIKWNQTRNSKPNAQEKALKDLIDNLSKLSQDKPEEIQTMVYSTGKKWI